MAKIENRDIFGPDVISKTTEDAKLLLKALDDLEKGFVDVAKAQQKIVNSEDQKTIQSVQKTRDAVKQLNDVEKASSKVKAERKRLSDSLNKTLSKENDTIIELQASLDQLKRKRTQLNKDEKKGLITAKEANRQRAETNLLIKATTKNLNASQKAVLDNSNQVKKSSGSFQALNVQVKQSNGLLKSIKTTLQTSLGFLGVAGAIAGVTRAFKDAFNRVRDFDKVMQNISGVTGIVREDLRGVEKDIISVAGSSIRTSNEVAKLAETLFTLGNSEREVRLLLKPVNDLSIALGTTSEEAADFLGQTLNAFGKGASSGQEFADIIANVRTSTSLDFQRIKDALGFVAPTASALGLSLGQVSAQVGVLQDNGIKAARAGRLLNTSFARLIEKGLTLDQALVKINESQNKVSTATNLFGKESFTLGLILAKNVDKTAELANEFDNLSEGSLKTLTDEQLKSMDAQLKILDSTYEKFIINIENGEGVLSDLFGGVIKGAIDAINTIDRVSTSLSSLKKGAIGAREDLTKAFLQFAGPAGKIIGEQFNLVDSLIEKETDEIAAKFIKKDLKTQKTITRNLLKRISRDKVALEGASAVESVLLEKRIKSNLLLLSKLEILNDEQKENNELIVDNTGAKNRNAKSTRELTGLIEKQSEVVKNLNEEIKRATTEEDILRLSIEFDVEQEELERLKRIVSSSLDEINKIELDLIEDATEKRIAKEREKSAKLIEQIKTNSRAEADVKNDLIVQENERLLDFELNEAIKSNKERIKQDADFARAEFEQRRTGFKTEEAFEKEKAEQFKAIKRNQLQAELDLLEFSGRDKDKLRIEQLKSELEGLNELGKGFEGLKNTIGDVVQVIGELIDEAFDKRIEAIGEKLNKTGENINRLRGKAQEGRLDSEESLAFEQKQEIELARQKEREQKKQQRTQAFFSVLSSFNSNDGNLPKTIADISVLRALAGGLTAFDGVDDTGARGNLDSKGGKLWTLHPNEQVWSKKDRGDVGFRNRDEIKDIVGMYDNGFMMDALNHDSADFMNKSSFVLNGMSTGKIESKLDDINRGINGIVIPENHFDYDLIRNIFEHRVKKGNRTTIKHSKLF